MKVEVIETEIATPGNNECFLIVTTEIDGEVFEIDIRGTIDFKVVTSECETDRGVQVWSEIESKKATIDEAYPIIHIDGVVEPMFNTTFTTEMLEKLLIEHCSE